jgi:two-component system, LuxR family, response regulator FixJ
MQDKTSIYVVDDDAAVRDSLSFRLRAEGYKTSTYASAREFLDTAPSLAPGCLLLDVRMPGLDGLELQKRLAERRLHFATIVITGHGDVPMAVRAMRAGAVDFIQKPFSDDDIVAALAIARRRLQHSSSRDRQEAAAARVALLSRREREVLEGLLAGLPNKTLAFELGISPRTVEIHRARVMDKMQARSLSGLVRMALNAEVEPRNVPAEHDEAG